MIGRPKSTKERGAVLITTLLLMSVMAVITVSIMDDIRFSIKRAASTQIAEQLEWFSRGGEDYAENWLGTQLTSDQKQLSKMILLGVPAVFELEGGELQIRARDGQNCFNVNTLAEADNQDQARKQLATLLSFLEISDGEAGSFAARIQDWVDTDAIPGQGGAEDFIYTTMKPAYRAANTVMADISELREIQGIDEEIYQTIRPYLCALPNTDRSVLNINTMGKDDTVLLGALFGSQEGLSVAQEIIADRPLAGYESKTNVTEKEVYKDLGGKGAFDELFDVKTQTVDLQIDIRLGDQQRGYIASFKIGNNNSVKLVSRRSSY